MVDRNRLHSGMSKKRLEACSCGYIPDLQSRAITSPLHSHLYKHPRRMPPDTERHLLACGCSQILTVEFTLPETTREPSGLNATDHTRPVCSESARQLEVDTFQIFTVEEPAGTICQASELKATESTLAVCPTAIPLHSHLSMHWEASMGNACTRWTASGGTCLWMLHRESTFPETTREPSGTTQDLCVLRAPGSWQSTPSRSSLSKNLRTQYVKRRS